MFIFSSKTILEFHFSHPNYWYCSRGCAARLEKSKQPLSHSARVAAAATQPLSHSEWLGSHSATHSGRVAGAATQPLARSIKMTYYSMKRFQGYVKILWTYPTPLHSQILRKVSAFLSFARLWSALPWRRCQSTRVSALPAVERSWTRSSPNVHFIHCFISNL